MPKLRELRYVRRQVKDLEMTGRFAADGFGLMPEDSDETQCWFRADERFYSLCLSTELPDAVGFNVDKESDLDHFAKVYETAGQKVQWLEGDAAARRGIKRGITVVAPNGVQLEIVWRHLQSGQPYHGPRNTGLNGFSAVQLASRIPSDDVAFWQNAGMEVADFAGESAFLGLGDRHHQVAVYNSERNGLLGAIWQVASVDNVMRHWHTHLSRQVGIAHGPGRQPTSGARFVAIRAPDGFLMTYATEMDPPTANGPRQFRDAPSSHCAWGSPSDLVEFGGSAK